MNILENTIAACQSAKENNRNCPICNAPIIVSGCGEDGEIWYDHDCECLMELKFFISSDEVNVIFDEQYYDYESPQETSDFNTQVETVHIPIYLNRLQRANDAGFYLWKGFCEGG